MFIENVELIYPNPEGILCKKTMLNTYNPFGINENGLTFPININSLREYGNSKIVNP
jgi:hypothetical protein